MSGDSGPALLVIGGLLLVLVGVAFADHRHKAEQMQRADVARWYCEHENQGCGADPEELEHRSERIEHGWQQRERGYTLLLGALAGSAVTVALGARRSGAEPTRAAG